MFSLSKVLFAASKGSAAQWVQLGSLIMGNYTAGASLSLSSDGNTLAIGVNQQDTPGQAGFVMVYVWNGNWWFQRGGNILSEGSSLGGSSVSLSDNGNVIAIGEPIANNGKGRVKIYSWSGSAWAQTANIDGSLDFPLWGSAEQNGFSLSLSGDGQTVAIGSKEGNTVRIFSLNVSTWRREYSIPGNGYSVSLSNSGSTVAIGSPDTDIVKIYVRNGEKWTNATQQGAFGDWIQRGSNLTNVGRFGHSVSISSDGTKLAVARDVSENIISLVQKRGAVRAYSWNGTQWSNTGEEIVGYGSTEELGYCLSISGDGSKIAIGAPGDFGGQGSVKIYELKVRSPGEEGSGAVGVLGWVLKGRFGGSEANGRNGTGVAISDSGSVVATGQPYASGGNGVQTYKYGIVAS